MCAFSGVTVHYFASDDVLAAWKNTVVGVRIETNQFVLVHEGDVDGQVFVNEVHLFER